MSRYGCAALVVASLWALPASAQVLTCASSGSDRCAVVHYHVQEWVPQTKGTVELFGTNSFSSMNACEAARAADMKSNAAAVDHLTKTAPRLKATANRYGNCHCDMTSNPSDPHFLDDTKREAQLRLDHDIRLQLADAVIDNGLTVDSPVVRALFETPRLSSGAQWPRVVSVPEPSKQRLLEPDQATMKESTITVSASTAPAPSKLELVEAKFDAALDGGASGAAVEESSNRFIDAEMKRAAELLDTIGTLPDGADKERLLETLNDRMVLLTNLSRLVESAGQRSRLAAATGAADSNAARLDVVKELFGSDVAAKWAPAKPAEMIVALPSNVTTDPTGVLRDTTGKYKTAERQLALYALLARTAALPESQEAWLIGIIEGLLKD